MLWPMHEHAFGHLGTLRANFSITQCRHYIRDVHKALSLQLLSQGVGHNIIWVLVRVSEKPRILRMRREVV